MKAVTAHMDRLLRLADDATLRSELTLFGLARDAEQSVQEEHRAGNLPWTSNPRFCPNPKPTFVLASNIELVHAFISARDATCSLSLLHSLSRKSIVQVIADASNQDVWRAA